MGSELLGDDVERPDIAVVAVVQQPPLFAVERNGRGLAGCGMSKRRLVITAVLAGQSQSEVARTYGVSQGWISRLMARHRAEGDAAFEPRSRAPQSSPATPNTIYTTLPAATPDTDRASDTHDRTRHDKIDKAGSVTLRVAGRLRHIGVGRTYARTSVILLVQDLHVTIINAATGQILRDLIIDPRRDYQPTGQPPGPTKK